MKTLIISFIFLFSVGLSAQPLSKHLLKAKELSGIRINTLTQKGKLHPRSEPFRLDSFNVWFWNMAEERWELGIRNQYSYNEEGLPEVLTALAEQNGVWDIISRDSILYDDEGRVILTTFYGWDGSMLLAFARMLRSYGPNSEVNIFQFWDGSEWINQSRSETLLDANGQIIGETSSNWNGIDWEVAGRGIYHYNVEGLNDTITSQILVGGVWENTRRTIFTYDDQERIISQLHQDFVSGQWVNNYRITYSYENGILTLVDEEWVLNQWEVVGRTVFMIVDDRIINHVTSSWDGLEWLKGDSTHYYYSDLGVAVNPISQLDIVSIYPNPVRDVLMLEFNANVGANSSIDIITCTGERVYRGNISSDTKQVNVNHLASGLYFAVINDGHHMSVVKFMKSTF